MIMKSFSTLLAPLLLAGATAQAAIIYSSGFANSGVIPDGNPTGWSDTRTVGGLRPVIADVNVSFTLSGGANGDLVAYLNHGGEGGVTIQLLNRVGTGVGTAGTYQYVFGFSDAGFNNITLDQQAAGGVNIHGVSPATDGSYLPDGGSLNTFNDSNPNGNWTLSFFDLAGGNDPSTLTSWSLDITAVPEPVTWALGIFGVTMGVVLAVRRRASLRKLAVRLNAWMDAV